MSTLRPELGDFSSIVCLKAVVIGVEDALGEKAAAISLIAAGRARGKALAEQIGLSGQSISLDQLAITLNKALGKEGTRLCAIDKIVQVDQAIRVYTRETICTSGEPMGSPRTCTYTLGAVQGALEQTLGKRLRGKHVESVLRGSTHDVLEFSVLG